MRGIRRIHHIDRADVAGIFLADALEHPLRSGALDAHCYPRYFASNAFASFGDRQVGRGVIDDLTFLLRRLDQCRGYRLRAAALRP
jgi:hypothetical protein